MSGSIFLVNLELPETRIAEVRDGRLFALSVDRGGRLLGDVFKGRIENVLPGMDAAFVNIGLARNALIYAGDIGAEIVGDRSDGTAASIERVVRVGDELIVQIARPPVGSKGARVSSRISLPGRFVVLVSNSDTVGVSRRLENEDERTRLRRIADKLRPLDHGVIVRTEAEGIGESEIIADINALNDQLQGLRRQATQVKAPFRLHRDLGAVGRMIRDRLQSDVEQIIVDSSDLFDSLRHSLSQIQPDMAQRVSLYRGGVALFEAYGVEKEIAAARGRTVPLRQGACIVIDETEALIAIDVNTGRFVGKNRLADTVLQTNLQAVEEVARQLRIRDLAGVIVIDFIDMERTRDRAKVLNALEAALKADRAKTRIVQLSPSGLVEMTRRREGASLRQSLLRPCPYCSGDGMVQSAATVAINVKRQLRGLSAKQAGDATTISRAIQITLHPEPACAFLGTDDEMIRDLEREIGLEIFLDVDFAFHLEAARILTGAPPDFASSALHFRIGERFQIAARVPLYPQAEPQFLVLGGKLIKIENLSGVADDRGASYLSAATLIEITAVHRWYLAARLISS